LIDSKVGTKSSRIVRKDELGRPNSCFRTLGHPKKKNPS